jgi:pimeloyl-ACP methyl ester carboxylesterase
MATLERDGVRLAYTVHGAPTQRPPLLLTHGFGASAQMWYPNLPALSADRQVLTWDVRGHGASDAPERFDHDDCVADMAALLDVLDAPRAVLGGMSLGGYLSLAFHARHAERVAALVLVDTGPGFRSDDAREEWNATALRTADALDERGLGVLPPTPEHVLAEHANGAAGVARAARGILTQRDGAVFASLPQIAVPALVVVGADDTPFLAAADAMAARIPRATKVVIEGAGHASNMDRPAEFDRAVLDFLKETS